MEVLYWALLIIGGFLLGSVMFAQWIPKMLTDKDICEISVDNNPGTFNAFKHCGAKIGTLCLFCDLFKGFLPVFIASYVFGEKNFAFSLVMLAPVLGHAVGLFNHLHGGKCIATAFGVMIGVLPVSWIPLITLAVCYFVATVLIRIKNGAKNAVIAFAMFMIISCAVLGVLAMPYLAAGCGFVAVMPIVKFLFSKNGMVDNKIDKRNA